MPDLDDAHGGLDAQIAGDAGGRARAQIDDRMEQRIVAHACLRQPGAVVVRRGEGPVGEIGPDAAVEVFGVGGVKLAGVTGRVDGLDAAVAALHGGAGR